MEKFSGKRIPLAQSEKLGPLVPDALPILLRWAQEGDDHTYTDLARELHDRNGHSIKQVLNYGRVAGGVAQAIEWLSKQWGEPIPPLHAIVISKNKGVPGDGAVTIVPAYFDGKPMATEEDRKAQFEEAKQDVFTYPHWDWGARALGAHVVGPDAGEKPQNEAQRVIAVPKGPAGRRPRERRTPSPQTLGGQPSGRVHGLRLLHRGHE